MSNNNQVRADAGMNSLLSFQDRGPWGRSSWRGNCSGHIYKSLFEQYTPSTFCDPMMGSGTSIEVANEMGIQAYGLDLHKGFNILKDSILQNIGGNPVDMVFSHPPYHCLHPESLVIQADGTVKQIQHIVVGDKVINKNGEIVDVVATANKANTKNMKRIHVRGMNIEPLEVTEDHLCLVIESKKCKYKSQQLSICDETCKHPTNKIGACKDGDAPYHQYAAIWKSAGEIRPGDYLVYVSPKHEITVNSISLVDYLEGEWFSLQDDYVWYQKNKTGHTKRGKNCQYGIKNTIVVDDEFAYLAGLFVAEGSTPIKSNGGTIYFTFNICEKDYAESVIRIMRNKFGVDVSRVRDMSPDKAMRVEIYSKPLAIVFASLFGRGARNKVIPECIIKSGESVRKAFLKGLFHGDGSESVSSFCTSSRNLIEQTRMMCASLGFVMSTYYSTKTPRVTQIAKNKNPTVTGISYYGQLPKAAFANIYSGTNGKWHDKVLRHGGLYGLAVKKVDTFSYDGDVYDIQVSEGESFLTPSGIVHNCMITYSGEVWGSEPHPDDLSRCIDDNDFNEKMHLALLNQREATKPGGLYGMLIGDLRRNGKYSSYQAEAIARMPADELAAVIIKAQHNCVSDRQQYKLKHPRIMHEYILLWSRPRTIMSFMDDLACMAVQSSNRLKATWRVIVKAALMELGGAASLADLYEKLSSKASDKIKQNPSWQAKVRQVLQLHPEFLALERGVWSLA